MQHRPNCRGELKIIADIPHRSMRAPVFEHILSHLGLAARAPSAAELVCGHDQAVAVLLSRRLIERKVWTSDK